ncbi:MAG: orotidine-5'-phosphate decarboxylase [Aureliella sp.]
MGQQFGDRLAEAVKAKRSAVCVGLDPRWQSLPAVLRGSTSDRDLSGVARVTETFCCEVVDAVADLVPIVKPQAAFFEQLGPLGMQCLANVVRHATRRGLMVLMDGKRGDIGSTAEAYAEAYLGSESPWGCDALTVNPYLGDDTLGPFYDRCQTSGAGIFVLVKTSNPGSRYLQDLPCESGHVYDRVAGTVEKLAQSSRGPSGYGSVGAVSGATYPEELVKLREAMPSAWLLIPGYGAQGAGAAEVRGGFDSRGLGAIVNSSRGIIFAYGKPDAAGLQWQKSVRQAAEQMCGELPRPQ